MNLRRDCDTSQNSETLGLFLFQDASQRRTPTTVETTSSKQLWRVKELVLTSAKRLRGRLSGRGIPGLSVVSSKAQALEGQVLLGQYPATGSVEKVKDLLLHLRARAQ